MAINVVSLALAAIELLDAVERASGSVDRILQARAKAKAEGRDITAAEVEAAVVARNERLDSLDDALAERQSGQLARPVQDDPRGQ